QISVILKFIVRKIWLRLRGKFLRFGEAVVVFGTPVHLRDYGDAPNVDGLAQDLMGRIEHEMPLLFVPLLARVLLLAEKPLDGVALEQEMQGMAARASDEATVVAQDFAANVARARDHLVQRGMITASDRGYAPADGQRPALRFYANSIAHFFDR
ncbi:MAG: glycerol-3-phosphate acyltransferase, partial [Roseobacter sp.]|nr:glycerol-3-phosphate acyltransferase [Roseobacter sp.]